MTIVVLTGGGPLGPWAGTLPPDPVVVAVDSGVDHARAVGWPVHHAVGDFDSVSAAGLTAAEAAGAIIQRHPTDKDETDLELGLAVAGHLSVERGDPHVLVIGTDGGRLDHVLANVATVAAATVDGLDVVARFGPHTVWTATRGRPVALELEVGSMVSVLAFGGTASGVTTAGLKWSLAGEALRAGEGRGLSNVVVGEPVTISVESGAVVVIHPHPRR